MKRKLYFIAAIASLSLTSTFAQFTTTIPNLEAYYPLDGNIFDSTSNNYDLGYNTIPTYGDNRFGATGSRSLITDANARVYKAPINDFTEFSFAFWAFPTNNGVTKQILLSRSLYVNDINTQVEIGKAGIYELYGTVAGTDSMTLNVGIHFGVSQQPSYTFEDMLTATKKIAFDTWSHIGFTYSSASNTLKIYVNGEPAGIAAFATPTNGNNSMVFTAITQTYNTLGDLIVGGSTLADWNGSALTNNRAYAPFYGRMDDLFLFSRAITGSEMASVKSMQDPSTAGLNEAAETAVSIFPNPTSDVMKVQLSSESNSAFSLYSTDNRVVMTGELNAGQNTINVQELAAGTYFLKTTINGTVVTKKITKQ